MMFMETSNISTVLRMRNLLFLHGFRGIFDHFGVPRYNTQAFIKYISPESDFFTPG